MIAQPDPGRRVGVGSPLDEVRDTVGRAARYIVERLVGSGEHPLADPEGYDLSLALARIAGTTGEIERQLAAACVAARARRHQPAWDPLDLS